MDNRSNGTSVIDRALSGLGRYVSFHNIFSDWVVANYLDDPQLVGGIYGYKNLDVHLKPSEVESFYPIARKASRVKPWAARYTEFTKDSDDILSLTVYKDDGIDIVAQLIEFGNETTVSSVKSGEAQSGAVLVPPTGKKAVLIVTSQPNLLVRKADYSNYNYSAEVQADITPVELAAKRKITTWGGVKRN